MTNNRDPLSRPRVSVVIPFYRGEDDIRACLQSILANDYAPERIYLVENSPEPVDLQPLTADFPLLEIIRSRPAIGFGRACNIGLYRSRAEGMDIAVLLNQDAVLAPEALRRLLEPFALNERLFATVPVSMDYPLQEIYPQTWEAYIRPVPELEADWQQHALKPFYLLRPNQANGACVAIRLDYLEQIGGFDPLFWMYGEDLDLFQRAIDGEGLLLALAPLARIGHRHSNFSKTGTAAERILVLNRHGRMIARAKQPGKPFWKALPESFLHNSRPYLRALHSGNLRLVKAYLRHDWRLLRRLPRIYRHRQPHRLRQSIRRQLEADMPNFFYFRPATN